jgi:hypothetical protein
MIPFFLAALILVIIAFCWVIWRWEIAEPTDLGNHELADRTIWLLLGLLLTAVFGLGAFLMYAFLHLG